MNKKIVVIVIGVVALFATAACNSDTETTTETAPVVKLAPATTTTTTTDPSIEKASLCVEALDSVTEGLTLIGDTVGDAVTVGGAIAREFLATSKEFVSTSMETVRLCAEFDPTTAAIAMDWLEQIEESLTTLQGLV